MKITLTLNEARSHLADKFRHEAGYSLSNEDILIETTADFTSLRKNRDYLSVLRVIINTPAGMVGAIKLHRDITGEGLKPSKDFVESIKGKQNEDEEGWEDCEPDDPRSPPAIDDSLRIPVRCQPSPAIPTLAVDTVAARTGRTAGGRPQVVAPLPQPVAPLRARTRGTGQVTGQIADVNTLHTGTLPTTYESASAD
jgi:hypothetical protein